MSEGEARGGQSRLGTLDVVNYGDAKVQVLAGSLSAKDPARRVLTVKDILTEKIYRIWNPTFTPNAQGKPGEGMVEKRNEDVGVTGSLTVVNIEID